MTVIFAKHEPYDAAKVYDVLSQMVLCGPPTIRCVKYDGRLYALDGSHRLYAANRLAMPVKIVLETVDCGEELEHFWQRVAPDRPRYDFEHATQLALDAFVV